MKKLTSFLCASLLVLAAFTGKSPDEVQVTGTLVDSKCYTKAAEVMGKAKMNFGNTHMVPGQDGEMMEMPNCATACANAGIPAAIVEGGEPGGKVYTLIAPASVFAEHMTKEARITGDLTSAGLVVGKAEVKEGGEWKEINISAMM